MTPICRNSSRVIDPESTPASCKASRTAAAPSGTTRDTCGRSLGSTYWSSSNPTTSPAESLGLRATLPANQAALRLYTEGIVKLRMFDALTARDLLTKAVVLDPSFSLSHSALAEAWSALGYDNNAKEQARKALDLSKDLPREERWLIEGRYREMTREWEKAIEAYKKLW